jgi:hypothetical protein
VCTKLLILRSVTPKLCSKHWCMGVHTNGLGLHRTNLWCIYTTDTWCTSFVSDFPRLLYGRATCHPCSGDTFYPHIGPPVLYTCQSIHPVTIRSTATCHLHTANCACHVSCKVVWIVQSASTWNYMDCTVNIFFLFGKMNRPPYNLSIRPLFEPVQVAKFFRNSFSS